jgi:hypothetical protein
VKNVSKYEVDIKSRSIYVSQTIGARGGLFGLLLRAIGQIRLALGKLFLQALLLFFYPYFSFESFETNSKKDRLFRT